MYRIASTKKTLFMITSLLCCPIPVFTLNPPWTLNSPPVPWSAVARWSIAKPFKRTMLFWMVTTSGRRIAVEATRARGIEDVCPIYEAVLDDASRKIVVLYPIIPDVG